MHTTTAMQYLETGATSPSARHAALRYAIGSARIARRAAICADQLDRPHWAQIARVQLDEYLSAARRLTP